MEKVALTIFPFRLPNDCEKYIALNNDHAQKRRTATAPVMYALDRRWENVWNAIMEDIQTSIRVRMLRTIRITEAKDRKNVRSEWGIYSKDFRRKALDKKRKNQLKQLVNVVWEYSQFRRLERPNLTGSRLTIASVS